MALSDEMKADLTTAGISGGAGLMSGVFGLIGQAVQNKQNANHWMAQNIYNQHASYLENRLNSPAYRMKQYIKAGLNPNLVASNGVPSSSVAKSADMPAANQYQFGGFASAVQNAIQNVIQMKELHMREALNEQLINESKAKESNYLSLSGLNYQKSLFELDRVLGWREHKGWSRYFGNMQSKTDLNLSRTTGSDLDNMFKLSSFGLRLQSLDFQNKLKNQMTEFYRSLGLKADQEVQESKARTDSMYGDDGYYAAKTAGQKAYNSFMGKTEQQRINTLDLMVDILRSKKKITEVQAQTMKTQIVMGMVNETLGSVARIMSSFGMGKLFKGLMESEEPQSFYENWNANY